MSGSGAKAKREGAVRSKGDSGGAAESGPGRVPLVPVEPEPEEDGSLRVRCPVCGRTWIGYDETGETLWGEGGEDLYSAACPHLRFCKVAGLDFELLGGWPGQGLMRAFEATEEEEEEDEEEDEEAGRFYPRLGEDDRFERLSYPGLDGVIRWEDDSAPPMAGESIWYFGYAARPRRGSSARRSGRRGRSGRGAG